MQVFFSLNVIVSCLQSLATFGAGINRLYSFAEYLEAPDKENQQQDCLRLAFLVIKQHTSQLG